MRNLGAGDSACDTELDCISIFYLINKIKIALSSKKLFLLNEFKLNQKNLVVIFVVISKLKLFKEFLFDKEKNL